MSFATVEAALEDIRAGRMVVVCDDEDRENEGDLTLAAEFCTPEAINFMARFGRGLICLTLTEDRADALRLGPMTQDNTSRFGTAFTESIEAREGVTTGISAADRAHTIRVVGASMVIVGCVACTLGAQPLWLYVLVLATSVLALGGVMACQLHRTRKFIWGFARTW